MRRLACLIAAAALLCAIGIHLLFHNEPIAEVFGNLAYFMLVVAVVAPNGSPEGAVRKE